MKNNKTSIIVTTHNYAQYLKQCIDSLLAQSVLPFEIIVINDSSTDNTDEAMAGYADKEIVQYFVVDFKSAQKSRNFGLEKAVGEYVLNMDADNYLDSKFLEKTQKILDENDNIDLVYTDHEVFGDEELISGMTQGKQWRAQNFDYYELKKTNYIDTTALVRRDGFGGFDENVRRFQDWDAWLTFLKGREAQRIPEHLLFKRLHKSAKTVTVQLYMERLRIMVKHNLINVCGRTIQNNVFKKVKGNVGIIIVAKDDNIDILKKFVNINRIKKNLIYIIDCGDRKNLSDMKKFLLDRQIAYRVLYQNNIDKALKGMRMNEYIPAYSIDYIVVINDVSNGFECQLQRRCEVCYNANEKLVKCSSFDDINYIIFNKRGIRKLLNP